MGEAMREGHDRFFDVIHSIDTEMIEVIYTDYSSQTQMTTAVLWGLSAGGYSFAENKTQHEHRAGSSLTGSIGKGCHKPMYPEVLFHLPGLPWRKHAALIVQASPFWESAVVFTGQSHKQ